MLSNADTENTFLWGWEVSPGAPCTSLGLWGPEGLAAGLDAAPAGKARSRCVFSSSVQWWLGTCLIASEIQMERCCVAWMTFLQLKHFLCWQLAYPVAARHEYFPVVHLPPSPNASTIQTTLCRKLRPEMSSSSSCCWNRNQKSESSF